MEDRLKEFEGREIDVNCGSGAIYRGTVEHVKDGILILKDDNDLTVFIAIDRIVAVAQRVDPVIRPGFIA